MRKLVSVLLIGSAVALVGMVSCASSPYYYASTAERPSKEAMFQNVQAGPPHGANSLGLSQAGPHRQRPAGLPGGSEESGACYTPELWIISKAVASTTPDEPAPGCGELRTRPPGEDQEVAVPLKHTDVKGRISGYIATVEVTQQYHNPYSGKIEAVYTFPLPADAAVNEFLMTVGERRIRGIIRERAEAEQIYRNARSQGYVASLMTQERPNVFTQAVANIEPGKSIDIHIKYFHTLAYDDGWYEWVFPMVVGPRFNPPGTTAGIGAVGRGSHGSSGQRTEVQYLKAGERSGHDISLAVQVDAGVAIEELRSVNHVVHTRRPDPAVADVALSDLDAIPNKDFVLRYRVAGRQTKSALLVHRDAGGGHFTLMVYPPEGLASLPRKPIEMVFVLDCSGSMNGRPIEQAKAAVERGLRRMGPEDTFQVIQFSNRASHFGGAPVPASKANVERALRYVASMQGEGGTMMIEGVKAALDFPHDDQRLRFVAFLTDGFIGNETEILGEVYRRLGPSRIFSFGVGSSTNRYLLDHMAMMGRGAVAYLGMNDSGAEVMDAFFERISHPAMTDLSVDFGSMKASQVYPQHIPDLFVGRPVMLTGRFSGDGPAIVRIHGRAEGQDQPLELHVNLDDRAHMHAGIPAVWARMQIAELAARAVRQRDFQPDEQIKTVALEYGLMSPFTSFVAVDSLTRTAGDHGTSVGVAVPVPDGVRYETTVEER